MATLRRPRTCEKAVSRVLTVSVFDLRLFRLQYQNTIPFRAIGACPKAVVFRLSTTAARMTEGWQEAPGCLGPPRRAACTSRISTPGRCRHALTHHTSARHRLAIPC